MDDFVRENNPLLDNDGFHQEILRNQKAKRSKNLSFFFGLTVVIFSLIGFFGCVFSAFNFFSNKGEQKKKAEFAEYDNFLVSVAAVDPDSFDDITAASMDELIEIAVWSIMRSDMEPDKYDYSSGELAIPLYDVEQAFIKYFGTQVTIDHRTVTGYGYEFSYSAEDGCYYIPLTTLEPLFTPRVTATEKKGDTVILTVGFINASSWKQDGETGEISRPEPDKYVKITLRTSGNASFISSVRSSSLPETAIVATATTVPAQTEEEASSQSAE